MSEGENINCPCCGASVSPDVPEYYVEIESFRLITEHGENIPRRGSPAYHEAMERLRPEVRASYLHNVELYNHGHLWCPTCGNRLSTGPAF